MNVLSTAFLVFCAIAPCLAAEDETTPQDGLVQQFTPATGCHARLTCKSCQSEGRCEKRTIMCEKGALCKVYCMKREQCMGATVFAEEAAGLEVLCAESGSCRQMTVHGDKAQKVRLFCDKKGSCAKMRFLTGEAKTSELNCRSEMSCVKSQVTAKGSAGGKVILNGEAKKALHQLVFNVEMMEAGVKPSVYLNCFGEEVCSFQSIDASNAKELQVYYEGFMGSEVFCPQDSKCVLDLTRETKQLPLTIHTKQRLPESQLDLRCGHNEGCLKTTVQCDTEENQGQCAFSQGEGETCPRCKGTCGGEEMECPKRHGNGGKFGRSSRTEVETATIAEPYDSPPMDGDAFGGNLTCGEYQMGEYSGAERVVFDVDISGWDAPYMFYLCDGSEGSYDPAIALYEGDLTMYEAGGGSGNRPVVEDDDSCIGEVEEIPEGGASPVAVMYAEDVVTGQDFYSLVLGEFDPAGDSGNYKVQLICGEEAVDQDATTDPTVDDLNVTSSTLTCGMGYATVSTVGSRAAVSLSLRLGDMDGKDVIISTGCPSAVEAESESACGESSIGLFLWDETKSAYELVTSSYWGYLKLDSSVFERMSTGNVSVTQTYVLTVAAREPDLAGMVSIWVGCDSSTTVELDYDWPPAPGDMYVSDPLVCNAKVTGTTTDYARYVYEVNYPAIGYDLIFHTCYDFEGNEDVGICLWAWSDSAQQYTEVKCNNDADTQTDGFTANVEECGDPDYGNALLVVTAEEMLGYAWDGGYTLYVVVGGELQQDSGYFEMGFRCGEWNSYDSDLGTTNATMQQQISCSANSGTAIASDIMVKRQLFRVDYSAEEADMDWKDLLFSTCGMTDFDYLGMTLGILVDRVNTQLYPRGYTFSVVELPTYQCDEGEDGMWMFLSARTVSNHLDVSDEAGVIIGTTMPYDFNPDGLGTEMAYGDFDLEMTCGVGAGIPPQNEKYGTFENAPESSLMCDANDTVSHDLWLEPNMRKLFYVEFDENLDYVFVCDNEMASVALYSEYASATEAAGDDNRMDAAFEYNLISWSDQEEFIGGGGIEDGVNAIGKVYQLDYAKTHVLVAASKYPDWSGNCTLSVFCGEMDYDYKDGPVFARDTELAGQTLMCDDSVDMNLTAGKRYAFPIELPTTSTDDIQIVSCGADIEPGMSLYCRSKTGTETYFWGLDDSSEHETNNMDKCTNGEEVSPLVRADSSNFDSANEDCFLVVGPKSGSPSEDWYFSAKMNCGNLYSTTSMPTTTESADLANAKLDPLASNEYYGPATSEGNLTIAVGESVRGDVYATGRVSFDVDLSELTAGETRCFSTCTGTTFQSGLALWQEVSGAYELLGAAAGNCPDAMGSEICVFIVDPVDPLAKSGRRGAVNLDIEPGIYTTVITATEIDPATDSFVGGKFEFSLTEESVSDTTAMPTPAPVPTASPPTTPAPSDGGKDAAGRASGLLALVVAAAVSIGMLW